MKAPKLTVPIHKKTLVPKFIQKLWLKRAKKGVPLHRIIKSLGNLDKRFETIESSCNNAYSELIAVEQMIHNAKKARSLEDERRLLSANLNGTILKLAERIAELDALAERISRRQRIIAGSKQVLPKVQHDFDLVLQDGFVAVAKMRGAMATLQKQARYRQHELTAPNN